MGVQLKTVGKVLIVMGIVMFMAAPLFRDTSLRQPVPTIDHAIGPSHRSLLARMSQPPPDGATFCYLCALSLGMVGVPLVCMGHAWGRKKQHEPAVSRGGTVV